MNKNQLYVGSWIIMCQFIIIQLIGGTLNLLIMSNISSLVSFDPSLS